ncbi:MAG TPA: SAM-dependent methyltransferase [Bacteroidales bacterium]|nr:SAM-dependent methyltransferase [Bacteroidales bacterium]
MSGTLYLFPVHLSDSPLENVLPEYNRQLLLPIRQFIVEDVRTARRFLKANYRSFDIDSCTFHTLNKHTTPEQIASYLNAIQTGQNMGLLSEAGCPAIADPGADIVRIAQEKGIKVVPLVGPSSILLALMGSGFNGQRFAFEGYLPVEKEDRLKTIRRLEARSYSEDMTQIFIETPYRNEKMLEDLVHALRPQTRICVAFDLTGPEESILSKSAAAWKKTSVELTKKPCIFLLYRA